MSSNLFIVFPGSQSSQGLRSGRGGMQTLTINDADAIAKLENVQAVAPRVSQSFQVTSTLNNWSTMVYGVSPEYFSIKDWQAAFTVRDLAARTFCLSS